MAEKKKAEPKKSKAEAKPDGLSRPAELLLRNGLKTVKLHGHLMVTGRPDGIQLHGNNHQFLSITDDQLILHRVCENPDVEKQLYLDNGWTE
jgi:hypothetical protein